MASVRYSISGKHDEKGIKDAQNGLKKLGSAAKGLNTIFKGFIAFKGLQQVTRLANETTKAFATQQKALASLGQAINKNANLTEKSMKSIVKFTGDLQGKSIFGDEVLQEQAAFLANMGFTEERIKDVLKAATDLSSAGIGTLDSNVQQLTRTLSGQSTRLTRMVPELANLTKEQLENGDAVKILKEQYDGFGEAMRNTLDGKEKSFDNIIGDIKENIGSIFAVFRSSFLDHAIPVLTSFNQWFSDNLPKIINAFIQFPKIVKVALEEIAGYLDYVFAPDKFIKALEAPWNYLLDQGTAVLNMLVGYVAEIGGAIWDPLKYGFDLMVYWIKDSFTATINAIIEGVEKAANFLNQVFGSKEEREQRGAIAQRLAKEGKYTGLSLEERQQLVDDEYKKQYGESDSSKITLGRLGGPENKPGEFDGKGLGERLKSLADTTKTYITSTKENLGNLGSSIWGNGFGDAYTEAQDRIVEILNSELPDSIKMVLEPVALKMEEAANNLQGQSVTSGSGGDMDLGLGFGGLAEVLNSVVGGLGGFMGKIMEGIKTFQSVQAIMDPLSVIIQNILTTIQPTVDSLLKPLIGILAILGQAIGQMLIPILQRLEPVIKFLSDAFVWLYNEVIRPVGNGFIKMFVSINNFFIDVINSIIKALNKIPGINNKTVGKTDFESVKLNKINATDLATAGAASISASSQQTAGASYSGVRDVIVNIFYNNSYVNGDAREIALNIKNEIELAGALGY